MPATHADRASHNYPALDRAVEAVHRFNRFHTRLTGALDAPWLGSGLSLAQVRVLYELAHRDAPSAAELAAELTMDPGYLSRLLNGFRRRGWTATRPVAGDARRRALRLTPAGRRAFEPLQRAARLQVAGWLAPLPPRQRRALVDAMDTVERLLGTPDAAPAPIVLRPPRPGDLGWVVSRHGALYAREHGWDICFEGMVAGLVTHFVEHFDPIADCCVIAERGNEPIGSVFVVRQSKTVAKLRMLIVEPSARGAGLGRLLVREALRFAHDAGYRKIVLWTNEVLTAARRLYRDEGFVLERSEPHESFGATRVGEYWSRRL
jgi:DNA-binding MarR family transcriptional regulator/ribosomal protein S18 acetylase RimI-like enzyme